MSDVTDGFREAWYLFHGLVEMIRLADSWVTEINYVPNRVVALWEGPQLLFAKVKDADEQDWYILY